MSISRYLNGSFIFDPVFPRHCKLAPVCYVADCIQCLDSQRVSLKENVEAIIRNLRYVLYKLMQERNRNVKSLYKALAECYNVISPFFKISSKLGSKV